MNQTLTPTNGAAQLRAETEHRQQGGVALTPAAMAGVPAELRLQRLRAQYELVTGDEEIITKTEELKQTLAPESFRLGKLLILELAFKSPGMTDREYFEQMGFSWTRCQNAMTIAEGFTTADDVKGIAVAKAARMARDKRRERRGTAAVAKKRKKKGGYATTIPLDETGQPAPRSSESSPTEPGRRRESTRGGEQGPFDEPDERTEEEKHRDWLRSMKVDLQSLASELAAHIGWDGVIVELRKARRRDDICQSSFGENACEDGGLPTNSDLQRPCEEFPDVDVDKVTVESLHEAARLVHRIEVLCENPYPSYPHVRQVATRLKRHCDASWFGISQPRRKRKRR